MYHVKNLHERTRKTPRRHKLVLSNLFSKIRLRIYRFHDSIFSQSDRKFPGFLRALGARSPLFGDALEEFMQTKTVINLYPTGIQKFFQLTPRSLPTIQHITLIWTAWKWHDGTGPWHNQTTHDRLHDLRTQLSRCKNLKVIMLSVQTPPNWWYENTFLEMMQTLRMLIGDRGGLNMLIIRVQEWDSRRAHISRIEELERGEYNWSNKCSPTDESYGRGRDGDVVYTVYWTGVELRGAWGWAEEEEEWQRKRELGEVSRFNSRQNLLGRDEAEWNCR